MTVAYISHADCGRHDTGWHHPEHVGRLRAIPRALRNDFDLYQAIEHLESRHATADELAIAHDPDYVERVRELVEQGGGRIVAGRDGFSMRTEGQVVRLRVEQVAG